MPISVVSMVLNIAAGIGVWSGEWPLLNKIVLTLLLVGKCALFCWSAWMAEERGRRNGVAICAAANFVIAVYAYFSVEFMAALTGAAMLLLLAIWMAAVVCEKRASKVVVIATSAAFFLVLLLGVIFYDQIRQFLMETIVLPYDPGCIPGDDWK